MMDNYEQKRDFADLAHAARTQVFNSRILLFKFQCVSKGSRHPRSDFNDFSVFGSKTMHIDKNKTHLSELNKYEIRTKK